MGDMKHANKLIDRNAKKKHDRIERVSIGLDFRFASRKQRGNWILISSSVSTRVVSTALFMRTNVTLRAYVEWAGLYPYEKPKVFKNFNYAIFLYKNVENVDLNNIRYSYFLNFFHFPNHYF